MCLTIVHLVIYGFDLETGIIYVSTNVISDALATDLLRQ